MDAFAQIELGLLDSNLVVNGGRSRVRICVLGGDGYCGWATALYLSKAGHQVAVVDNFLRRQWDFELGVQTLTPIQPLTDRLRVWQELTGKSIELFVGDVTDYDFLSAVIEDFQPDAVVHFAEQRSAPYSMIDRKHAVFTQVNNVVGTLNVLFAIRNLRPDCHLVKLGTMGEYGTPNIDIEEGYIQIEHNGRTDVLPFPKQPGSFYHLSKVHDSHNMMFACKIWGLRATDLNQGVVYGTVTDEVVAGRGADQPLRLRRRLRNGAEPLLRAGRGRASSDGVRKRRADARFPGYSRYGSLHRDCLPESGQRGRVPRVQPVHRTVFGAGTGAKWCKRRPGRWACTSRSSTCRRPRVESEEHYYNAKHSKLIDLGLQPHYLSDSLLDSLMNIAVRYQDRIDTSLFLPQVQVAEARATARPSNRWPRLRHRRASLERADSEAAELCGIAGFTHRNAPRASRPNSGMRSRRSSIAVRISKASLSRDAVSLGAARLKIIDIEGGDQPIMSDDRRHRHRLQWRDLQSPGIARANWKAADIASARTATPKRF